MGAFGGKEEGRKRRDGIVEGREKRREEGRKEDKNEKGTEKSDRGIERRVMRWKEEREEAEGRAR